MNIYINDIATYSNNGNVLLTTDFLEKDIFINNLEAQTVLQGRGFRYIPFIYKIFHVVISEILQNNSLSKHVNRIGLISSYEYANLEANIDFENEIIQYGVSMVNPIKSPFTVCNSCAGWLAIKHNMQNLNLTVSSGRTSIISAIKIASHFIKSEIIDYCIVLSANLNQGCYKIIDRQDSKMKSEFATAILLSKYDDTKRLYEVKSTCVKMLNENLDLDTFLQSLSHNNADSRIIFDGECNNHENKYHTNDILSNRYQCSYLPLFLQDKNNTTQKTEYIYVIFDKAGSVGHLRLKS